MTDHPLQLTDAQRAGIERTDLSMAVTSGAGCGKTFVLARRYLKVLADDGRPDAPSRVVAVTFTDKAALQMRQRVAALLRERIDQAADSATKALANEWLSRLPDARISTTHGFCAALLRGNAIEAGIDPAYGVLADEFSRCRMLHEAVTDAARTALDRADDRHVELLERFTYPQVLEMLTGAVQERWRWRQADYADPDATLERWEVVRKATCADAWRSFAAGRPRPSSQPGARS